MAASDRTARAGLLLAAALMLFALLPAPGVSPRCADPVERVAEFGRTTEVSCDRRGAELRGPVRLLFGLPLDPNRADALTLETLPAIGPVRAAAIVEARRKAPFAKVEDLLRVRGIGRITLSRIAPHLSIGGSEGSRW